MFLRMESAAQQVAMQHKADELFQRELEVQAAKAKLQAEKLELAQREARMRVLMQHLGGNTM